MSCEFSYQNHVQPTIKAYFSSLSDSHFFPGPCARRQKKKLHIVFIQIKSCFNSQSIYFPMYVGDWTWTCMTKKWWWFFFSHIMLTTEKNKTQKKLEFLTTTNWHNKFIKITFIPRIQINIITHKLREKISFNDKFQHLFLILCVKQTEAK